MLGSIIGDIIGSSKEFHNTDDINFEFFDRRSTYTDDTILTVCTADVIMDHADYSKYYCDYCQGYPNRGWGGSFLKTVTANKKLVPYNSFGNGSAMRVAPIGWYCNDVDSVLEEAKRSAEVSHNHPEGVKGAQAVALAILLARNKFSKEKILENVEKLGYNLKKELNQFPRRKTEASCQNTIPLCFALFMDSENFEDAIRKTVYHGGDCDTTACIVGGIAEAYYGRPPREMEIEAWKRLDSHLQKISTNFIKKYVYTDFVPSSVNIL